MKVSGEKGAVAAIDKICQLHDRRGFQPITIKRRCGKIKGRLSYNGNLTCAWISLEDKSSPTAHMKSILLLVENDSREGCGVISLDILNAFIQRNMHLYKGGDCVIMKVQGLLVDWLLKISPATYQGF